MERETQGHVPQEQSPRPPMSQSEARSRGSDVEPGTGAKKFTEGQKEAQRLAEERRQAGLQKARERLKGIQ
ncbi:MAG: hypothetical protein A2722_00615 [Candidatus Doudnabacteria bacterium RIFCSPHIGHO2_01_FULL_50_11]|uniref:Uncharacterized protein n=1 Tax=Candidatus Doudnabacteria bacterium RIFCSPHIGHO2_01_FULL_50_11 TaxID=1817828 RepID=A0A1F5PMK2_9BACT|nr:MAG: hypothetical protein A2722_00615 [Candidatus Doudnabacteria bacterium RIFCSPHIGHO2_01_FULL_50_11]HLC44865.1 hypothetical protein [Patescibacteria group bacterium]